MKLSRSGGDQFTDIVKMIHESRYNAIKNVNAELVKLYWNIGEYISKKLESEEWGDAVVERLANYMQVKYPELRGFTYRGLYRMRQFYEAYRDNKFVSPLVTQISWTNHLIILSKTKTNEEKENYTKRELERQIDSGYYERVTISKKKVPPAVTQIHHDIML